MMTKEECMEALKNIELNYDAEYVNECCDEFCMKMKSYIITLEQLIAEHFDNPPLSFNDLKEGMWVWDDREKLYCIIRDIFHNKNLVTGFKTSFGNSDNRIMQGMDHFEENRFYRRQKEEKL